jgi:hypothetical protein
MSTLFSRQTKSCARRSIASPRHLLEWAAMLAALFVVVQLAELREFTSVLNGTIGSTTLSWQSASFLGAAYIFVYLGFVLGVPILILAAGILKLWQRKFFTEGNEENKGTSPNERNKM